MSVRAFVDTNVLIYAYDVDAGEKHAKASAIVKALWREGGAILSTQVLQEFYVNVTQKIPVPLSPSRARALVAGYREWRVERNDVDTILMASEVQERHRLSFWDAMIVAAASRAGAETLLTEDLNHGQTIEGVEVRSPFADD